MPLQIVHDRLANKGHILALWHLQESTEALLSLYGDFAYHSRVPTALKTERRRREWLASRLLLAACRLPEPHYAPSGKPLTDEYGISISHSADYVGLALSRHQIGLDIQQPVEKIRRVSLKYCSPMELDWAASNPNEELRRLTVIWCAKEAIFKYWGERVAFTQDIYVHPFDNTTGRIRAEYDGVHGKRLFMLHHHTIEHHECVVCTEEP